MCAALTGVPVQKAEDLFEHDLLIGGAGSGSAPSITSHLLSNLLGMKLKLVEGYKSVPDVSLAMMRKEVHGVCQSLNALQGGNLAGMDRGRQAQGAVQPRAGAAHEPVRASATIFEFAKTDEQRAILTLNASTSIMGRPMLTPPNVPADRVAALRKAFIEAVNQPELKAEVEKVGGEVTLVTGEDMQKTVADIMATPPAIAEKMQRMIQAR